MSEGIKGVEIDIYIYMCVEMDVEAADPASSVTGVSGMGGGEYVE